MKLLRRFSIYWPRWHKSTSHHEFGLHEGEDTWPKWKLFEFSPVHTQPKRPGVLQMNLWLYIRNGQNGAWCMNFSMDFRRNVQFSDAA